MKHCPSCNKTFADQNLSFCTDDGTPLLPAAALVDETTTVSPSSHEANNKPSPQVYTPRDWQAPDYQPPSFQISANATTKKKAWPWVMGILALVVIVLVGLGIAAAILIPSMMRAAANRNRSYSEDVQRSGNDGSLNSNRSGSASDSNHNENANASPAEEITIPPPTDTDEVLVHLTELEHEWTVANINADKKKLDRILAEDYVGTTSGGKSQGKADYLRTIERDTSILKWDFEDLKVALKGDRASLTGVIRLQLREQVLAFSFTDKFVWRDARWQAVSSEVAPINEGSKL